MRGTITGSESAEFAGGVDAGDDALAAGFFVTGSSVDLAGEEQSADGLHFERMSQLARIDGVVLDGVAGADHLGVLETGD